MDLRALFDSSLFPSHSLLRSRRSLAVFIAAPALMLSMAACGGGGDGADGGASTSEAPTGVGDSSAGAPTEGEGMNGGGTDEGAASEMPPVKQGDIDALAAKLGAEWGDCGESVVDMAGYPANVCIFPDELAVPGQSGNAVRISTFYEWDQADEYMSSVGDPEVTVIKNGYIVDGPTSKAVDAAVEILED